MVAPPSANYRVRIMGLRHFCSSRTLVSQVRSCRGGRISNLWVPSRFTFFQAFYPHPQMNLSTLHQLITILNVSSNNCPTRSASAPASPSAAICWELSCSGQNQVDPLLWLGLCLAESFFRFVRKVPTPHSSGTKWIQSDILVSFPSLPSKS